jgi:hypothetical protein
LIRCSSVAVKERAGRPRSQRVDRDHGADGAVAQKRCPHRGRGSAEINRKVESAQHEAEPVSKFVRNLIEQECRRAKPQSPLPVRTHQQSIEYERRSHRDLRPGYINAFHSRSIHHAG